MQTNVQLYASVYALVKKLQKSITEYVYMFVFISLSWKWFWFAFYCLGKIVYTRGRNITKIDVQDLNLLYKCESKLLNFVQNNTSEIFC